MTHPAKVLRAARKAGGRGPSSSGTKRALLDSATRLFADHGYAGTSLDEVVAAARVTKGAFYHHFPSKIALFESVFASLQDTTVATIREAYEAGGDPWDQARNGLRAFLEVSREPRYRRICMQEAPVALGHERFNEAERAASLGVVQDAVDRLLVAMGDSRGLNEAFAAVFYGAIRAAAEFVADAEDPGEAAARVEDSIDAILTGLRLLSNTADA